MLNLRNHISYWLLLSSLIETNTITDLDEAYMADLGDTEESEPFFIVEKSLEILFKYLQKLLKWHNSIIYAFYFNLLNLYYSYEPEKTY